MASLNNQLLVASYASWMEELAIRGFEPFFLSFMFRHIPGSGIRVEKTMREVVEQVYARSLIRIMRNPDSTRNRDWKPVWIVCPDYPVGKSCARGSLRDVTVNAGRHLQGTAMIPPNLRLKMRFDHHLVENESTYLVSPLRRIYAEPIRSRLRYVSGDYNFKQILRGRVSADEIVILPRNRSEMTRDREDRINGIGGRSANRAWA